MPGLPATRPEKAPGQMKDSEAERIPGQTAGTKQERIGRKYEYQYCHRRTGGGRKEHDREADRQNYIYVDTGAMYRAMGLFFMEKGFSPDDETAINGACGEADISIAYENGSQQVYLNGKNVTDRLRTEEAGKWASATSKYSAVRAKLVEMQQKIAASENVVMDGRDIGTVVLPGADLKIYLTASAETRARRRFQELTEKGIPCKIEEIEQDIRNRDYQDMHRENSPLKKAEDAVCLDSSHMSIEEVAGTIIGYLSGTDGEKQKKGTDA